MQTAHIVDTDHGSPERAPARLSDAIDVLVEVFGFQAPRARTISRRLQDSGLIRLGSYSTAPTVGVRDFVILLLAMCSDCTLRETPGAANDLDALAWSVHGDDVDANVTAGVFLFGLAEVALRGEAWVRDLKIEFVADRREVAVDFGGAVERFREPGASEAHRNMVKSVTISGAGLAEAAARLFA